MAGDLARRKGGMSTGGGLVVAGIVVALFWSLLLGVIIAVIGLVAFGGFVRGKWYYKGLVPGVPAARGWTLPTRWGRARLRSWAASHPCCIVKRR
jgi:hypothetical protein